MFQNNQTYHGKPPIEDSEQIEVSVEPLTEAQNIHDEENICGSKEKGGDEESGQSSRTLSTAQKALLGISFGLVNFMIALDSSILGS
jgi:hypothetical protein